MKTKVLVFGVFVLGASIGYAQAVSVGAIGGVPFLNPAVNGFGHDESRPYEVGAAVEFRLPAGFAIEADGIYRPTGTTTAYRFSGLVGPGIISSTTRTRGNSWEFPVLGKYYFRPRESGWQPFLATGWALRTVGFKNDGVETLLDENGAAQPYSFHGHTRSDLGVGAVVGAGVRLRSGRFAFLPEVRYTRWGSDTPTLRKNEAGFLLGITF